METADQREWVLVELMRSAHEAVGMEDFGARVLPSLERALGADAGFLYRSTEENWLLPVADDSPLLIKGYVHEYMDGDPFHDAWAGADLTLAVVSRMAEWPAMLRHPLYGEFCPVHRIGHLFHVRLTPTTPHLAPGSVNVMLFRTSDRPDFGDRELVTAARALPALEAASRRCLRAYADGGPAPFIEAILEETDEHAHVAFTPRGALLLCSRRAARLIDPHALPDDLVAAVCALGRLALGQRPSQTASSLTFTRRDGSRTVADLRLARTRTGDPFVAVTLSSAGRPRLEELRERFGLTQSEADVLGELALGLSNGEIASRRSVSVATVRTHVVHLLEKLGVNSRLRAALMVTRPGDDPA
jgi:DNA-binding CsgD family transcriptional regulator